MTETKKEPGLARLVIVLFAICAVTALLLGLVNMVTAPAIAANSQKKSDEAKAAVLPASSYEEVAYTGGDASIVKMWKGDDVGYVVQVQSSGFGGMLSLMVGVDNNGVCTGVSVLSHAETPGLGATYSKPGWLDQFKEKSGAVTVTKDGGEIVPLTGATITSRAISLGVTNAIAAAASMG